ncbi:MAG: ribosome rescue protein RqcH [Promethearchaeota archaeon]
MRKPGAISSAILHLVVKELQDLAGAHVRNVYEWGSKDFLLLKVAGGNAPGKQVLFVDGKERLHLTSFKYPVPRTPSPFVASLRKHMKNRRILRVYQRGFDRVVVFEINDPRGDPWKLVLEFFGGGNYYLLRSDGTIFAAKRYVALKDRRLLPNKPYLFPLARGLNPLELTRQDFLEASSSWKGELVRELARQLNVGGTFAEELCARAELPKEKKASDLNDDEREKLADEVASFFSRLRDGPWDPQVVLDDDGRPVALLPFEFVSVKGGERKRFPTMNQAVDEFYGQVDVEASLAEHSRDSEEQLSKEQRILKRQEEQIRKSEAEVEKNRRWGDLIYAHFTQVQELLDAVRRAKFEKKMSWQEIEAQLKEGAEKGLESAKLFSKFQPATKSVTVVLDGEPVLLSLEKSAQDNAEVYYARVKKARKKIQGAEEAIQTTKKRLKKKKQALDRSLQTRVGLTRARKKAWYEKFHWFESSDGYLVLGGRDAHSNEALFRKYVADGDVLLHTEMRGSPLVVVKNHGEGVPPRSTLEEAAQFVACFSNAWKMAWSDVKVFWVTPDQVSKTPPSGEFLPRGSFVVTGKRNYLPAGEMVHRVGLVVEEREDPLKGAKYYEFKVISGPPSALKGRTTAHVDLTPSKAGLSVGQVSKKVLAEFARQVPEQLRRWLKSLPVEEVQFHVPNGLANVLSAS